MNRLTDLRFLIGILFSVYGVILAIYGLASHPSTQTVQWNIDLWWGLLSLVFGLAFIVWSNVPEKDED
ncbi:hypothetical protein [Alicyclobacillus dauci]|uniref:Uncharacterized protein n=1 Tax=Alicyclobacillus dauci TaxID=1475485 RepID=A0ABY6Z1M6_9BACL|nr:hypothetical protein [Alicyclobacillus dauci]WAH36784.1 hypothetical protein NZD86_21850 [Alicyclobacillus dauci]